MIYTETLVNKIFRDMYHSLSNSFGLFSSEQAILKYNKMTNDYDKKFIWDMANKLEINKQLSSKQIDLLHKILPKYKSLLLTLDVNEQELDYWLMNFNHNIKIYTSKNVEREVRLINNHNLFFRFLYNPDIINVFKKIYKNQDKSFLYNKKLNGVIVEVDHFNIEQIMEIISKYGFKFDDELEQYFLAQLNSDKFSFEIVKKDNKYSIKIQGNKLIANWINFNILVSG